MLRPSAHLITSVQVDQRKVLNRVPLNAWPHAARLRISPASSANRGVRHAHGACCLSFGLPSVHAARRAFFASDRSSIRQARSARLRLSLIDNEKDLAPRSVNVIRVANCH
jgi:hypothetical protein